MGLLKLIFGKTTEKNKKVIDNEINKIKSGEINKIYPILKPGNWVGLKYGVIRKTLLGTTENPELVIGYGYDAPENFVFLKQDDLKDKSANEILEEAHKNLDEFEVDLNEVVPGKVIIIDGKDFCSEKILSKKFMLEIHKKLNSDKLLVSIPRRRNMMVTSGQNNKEIMSQFLKVHNNTWDDDTYGNAPIINALFEVVNGSINGVIDFRETNNK